MLETLDDKVELNVDEKKNKSFEESKHQNRNEKKMTFNVNYVQIIYRYIIIYLIKSIYYSIIITNEINL